MGGPKGSLTTAPVVFIFKSKFFINSWFSLDCDICEDEFFEGCDRHPTNKIEDTSNLIGVKTSNIQNAGRGAFNVSDSIIPVGTFFGPYKGKVIPKKDYEAKDESGYAWELMDPEKKRIIGYVDPGSDPDPKLDWLPMVNSANYSSKPCH